MLLFIALLSPTFCFAALDLGGLAPAPAEAAAVQDINVPTDLCDKEFCLAGVPAACGGHCILTPLNKITEYCSLKCISVWDSAEVKGCLADQAAGVYIQSKLTTISNKCNAGKIAAARRKAALAKYNKQFPCTTKVNDTAVVGLDSCLTGRNATATNCPPACSEALLGVPPKCRATFPELSQPWNETLGSCIAGDAAAPNAEASSVPGAIGGTPDVPGLAFAPVSGEGTSQPSSAFTAVAFSLGIIILTTVTAVIALHV